MLPNLIFRIFANIRCFCCEDISYAHEPSQNPRDDSNIPEPSESSRSQELVVT